MSPTSSPHVQPYVFEDSASKSLHFSIHEIQSRMRLHSPHALDLRYTRTMMGFLMFKPRPERIAMVGLGGGSLAKFCHHYLPDAHLDVAEINPHVIALRDTFCIPPDDHRFKVIAADGAAFIRDVTTRYDVLLLDGFDDQGLPPDLASDRFYRNCARALQPGGMLVANFPAGQSGLKTYVKRIQRHFADQVVQVGYEGLDNIIVLAFKPQDGQKPPARLGVLGRPACLDDEAWEQLMPSFAQIAKAWNDSVFTQAKHVKSQHV